HLGSRWLNFITCKIRLRQGKRFVLLVAFVRHSGSVETHKVFLQQNAEHSCRRNRDESTDHTSQGGTDTEGNDDGQRRQVHAITHHLGIEVSVFELLIQEVERHHTEEFSSRVESGYRAAQD